jgi:hypothetical protein
VILSSYQLPIPCGCHNNTVLTLSVNTVPGTLWTFVGYILLMLCFIIR